MEKPIDFETLQGMDVDADNDFLQFLLKSMIIGTDVPVNYIDANQEVDFARTLVMQNSSFVRRVISDQNSFSPSFSKMIQILYHNEYLLTNNNTDNKNDELKNENVELNELKIIFPVPVFLSLNATNDQISSSSQLIDFITSVYVDDNAENAAELKIEFKKEIVRKILPNINWDEYDKLFKKVNIDINEKSLTDEVNNSSSGEESEDDNFDEL